MIYTLEEKCAAAIAYLRSREKYLLDGGKWVPTSSDKTDVRKTIESWRTEQGAGLRLYAKLFCKPTTRAINEHYK